MVMGLLATVLKEVIVPELVNYIQERMRDTGEPPTKTELERKALDLVVQIEQHGKQLLEGLKQNDAARQGWKID